MRPDLAVPMPKVSLHELRRFFYNIAAFCQSARVLVASGAGAVVTGLVRNRFPVPHRQEHVRGLGTCGLSAADMRLIERDNILRLIQRLA